MRTNNFELDFSCLIKDQPQEIVRRFTPRCLNPPQYALEIGAGSGRNLLYLKKLGYEVFAIESEKGMGKINFSSELVTNIIRQKELAQSGIQIINAPGLIPNIPAVEFKIIIMINVLQYLPVSVRKEFVDCLMRHLKDHGLIIGLVTLTRMIVKADSQNISRFRISALEVSDLFANLNSLYFNQSRFQISHPIYPYSKIDIRTASFVYQH